MLCYPDTRGLHNMGWTRSSSSVLQNNLHLLIMKKLLNNNEARPRERSDRGRFCLQAKKPLPSGSYERRVPTIKIKIIFLYQGCLSLCLSVWFNIVIGHLRRPYSTHTAPMPVCTRTHTNEAFSCWFRCNTFTVDQARRGYVCLSSQVMLSYRSACAEL